MKAPNLEMKERQMLELLADGASTRLIAKRMGYSDGTVRVYLHNLYKKIGVKNRTEALLWQLAHGRPQEHAPVPQPPKPTSQPDESFGDVALRDGLLGSLGIMESFTGPYGRVWEVGARLKGAPLDAVTLGLRDEARGLWRALLHASFGQGKGAFDEGRADRWIESEPSLVVLLASLLLLGGYSHAGDRCVSQLARAHKAGRLAARELALVRAMRDALYSTDDEALAAIHQLAVERTSNPVVRQLAVVALFHIYRQHKDAARARDTANVIWSEAESARRQLEAMGVRPFGREAAMPRVARGIGRTVREKSAATG